LIVLYQQQKRLDPFDRRAVAADEPPSAGTLPRITAPSPQQQCYQQ
jgi:hypothetical protein